MIVTYKYRIKDKSACKTLRRHALILELRSRSTLFLKSSLFKRASQAVNQVWNYCNSVQKDIESRYLNAAINIKEFGIRDLQALGFQVSQPNTAGTAGIYACGDTSTVDSRTSFEINLALEELDSSRSKSMKQETMCCEVHQSSLLREATSL